MILDTLNHPISYLFLNYIRKYNKRLLAKATRFKFFVKKEEVTYMNFKDVKGESVIAHPTIQQLYAIVFVMFNNRAGVLYKVQNMRNSQVFYT